jgi:hypothetical protein
MTRKRDHVFVSQRLRGELTKLRRARDPGIPNRATAATGIDRDRCRSASPALPRRTPHQLHTVSLSGAAGVNAGRAWAFGRRQSRRCPIRPRSTRSSRRIRVCPMGGDRTCPDDCPLAMWHGLSLKERKKKRKSFSQRLYQDGYTLEEIAVRLGFKKSTISNDLAEFSKNGKLKHDKTASNPRVQVGKTDAKFRRRSPASSADSSRA